MADKKEIFNICRSSKFTSAGFFHTKGNEKLHAALPAIGLSQFSRERMTQINPKVENFHFMNTGWRFNNISDSITAGSAWIIGSIDKYPTFVVSHALR